jgi:nucleotide-binding universal stress UspA family protein
MRPQALLPLVTYPEPNDDAIAYRAVAMAGLIGADINALAINADIPPVSSALSRLLLDVPGMIEQAETLSRQRGEHLLALVEQAALATNDRVTINRVSAPVVALADTAATHARYFDFIFVGAESGNPTSRSTAEAVIFGAGRPSILLPDRYEVTAIDHVAIAWDGTRVAARAVGDAMPILDRAKRISILTALDEKPLKESDAGERLTGSLRRRGLPAEMVPIRAAGRPIATTLQLHAIERGANLLVMGGYGHSRVRDFMLGGATQGVLSDPLLPVLISH